MFKYEVGNTFKIFFVQEMAYPTLRQILRSELNANCTPGIQLFLTPVTLLSTFSIQSLAQWFLLDMHAEHFLLHVIIAKTISTDCIGIIFTQIIMLAFSVTCIRTLYTSHTFNCSN